MVNEYKAEWVDVNDLPQLGFDHPKMIEQALSVMRRKILTDALAFNLLPEYFTLTQLQTLVETVTGKELDKRNFRKRITEIPGVEQTDLIDKESSRRGARMYRYVVAHS